MRRLVSLVIAVVVLVCAFLAGRVYEVNSFIKCADLAKTEVGLESAKKFYRHESFLDYNHAEAYATHFVMFCYTQSLRR